MSMLSATMKLELDFATGKISDADEAVFSAARAAETPALNPESQPLGNPEGRLHTHCHVSRWVYPDVARNVVIYVPQQYDDATANLIVFQDGKSYLERCNAAIVLDNLIAQGDLPPTIAVFIQPGDLPGQVEGSQQNRSLEYDRVTDAYIRYLDEELLHDLLVDYTISPDPERRAICGMSSGGICAFNAAWERPDLFGRVISHVGSFTNIRGGHCYPTRVRMNKPRPIRVFLQGGAGDLDRNTGCWPIANFDMAAALKFLEYDMRFEFGKGAHDFTHAAAILSQTLRWIFRS